MSNAAHMQHPADRAHFALLDREERAERHREAVVERLTEELLTTGSDQVDDERFAINLNADTLRRLYAQAKAGKPDALAGLVDELNRAALAAAEEEADAVVASEIRAAKDEAAADRAENIAWDR